MRSLGRFWIFFDYLLEVLAVFGMVLLTFIMLSVCWEVITRYFLGRGTIWVDEICEYILLYITFLGTAWLLKNEWHVTMDIVIARLNLKTRLLINSVTSLLGALLCLILALAGG